MSRVPPIVMAWGGMCVGAAALAALGGIGVLPMTARATDVSFLGHRVSWMVPVLGLSLLAAVVAYVAGIGAARRLGAKLASFIGMAEVLFVDPVRLAAARPAAIALAVPRRRVHSRRNH